MEWCAVCCSYIFSSHLHTCGTYTRSAIRFFCVFMPKAKITVGCERWDQLNRILALLVCTILMLSLSLAFLHVV